MNRKFLELKRRVQAFETPDEDQEIRLAEWLLDEGLNLYSHAFREETGFSVLSSPDGMLIEKAFGDGSNDLVRKLSRADYYRANASIFIKTTYSLAREVLKTKMPLYQRLLCRLLPRRITRHVYRAGRQDNMLLINLIHDAMYLIVECSELCLGRRSDHGIGKSNHHQALVISHAAQQIAYGGSPTFSFSDNHTEAATALFRVALESRIRFGFGFLAIQDSKTGALKPLNLSRALTVVKRYERSIMFPVPFTHVKRLYGWSNVYVHVGERMYRWMPMFALRHLNGFLRGGRYSTAERSGSSAHAGIQLSWKVLKQIQQKMYADVVRIRNDRPLMLERKWCDLILTDSQPPWRRGRAWTKGQWQWSALGRNRKNVCHR